MKFKRVDDSVVVGIDATLFFEKGEVYDVDEPNLIELFEADPGWETVDDGPKSKRKAPDAEVAAEATTE